MDNSAVIFDLDGTLFDTAPEKLSALRAALADVDLAGDINEEQARSYMGHGLVRFIKRAITKDHWAEPDHSQLQRVHKRMLFHYERLLLTRNSLYPGVIETLEQLQDKGWLLGMATNKLECFTRPLLHEFLPTIKFGAIVGGDTLASAKPDPGPLLHIARVLGIAPTQALMVGDSITDIKASQAAGYAATITVSYGYHQATGLAGLKSDYSIDSMYELGEVCRNFLVNYNQRSWKQAHPLKWQSAPLMSTRVT